MLEPELDLLIVLSAPWLPARAFRVDDETADDSLVTDADFTTDASDLAVSTPDGLDKLVNSFCMLGM